MTAIDILFDFPTVLANFGNTLIEVLTTEVQILGYTISMWQILATASAAIVLAFVVYSIIAG